LRLTVISALKTLMPRLTERTS